MTETCEHPEENVSWAEYGDSDVRLYLCLVCRKQWSEPRTPKEGSASDA